jgi:hypothetical protein
MLKPLELFSPSIYPSLFVFDDARKPEHAHHCGMRVDLSHDNLTRPDVPSRAGTELFQPMKNTYRPRTFCRICGMTRGMLAVKEGMSKTVDRSDTGCIRTDYRSVDRYKRCFLPAEMVIQAGNQLIITVRVSVSGDACGKAAGFQETNTVFLLFPPGKVDSGDEQFISIHQN